MTSIAHIQAIAGHPRIAPLLHHVAAGAPQLVDAAIAVQQIAAPTFAEAARADYVEAQMRRIGLHDVARDALHNVYGRLPGRTEHDPVVVSAHGDTVFPAETNLAVRRDGPHVYGPGIADNSAGVAGILALAEALLHHGVRPQRSVWFVMNVGEEGLGDLAGMRAVTDRFAPSAAAFIVVEGGMYGHILHEAIGVRRYEIKVTAQGGHSWSDFGRTSAIHVLGRLIHALDQLSVPRAPKTTYNVGIIEGGTSINTIAAEARLLLDLRSEAQAELATLVDAVHGVVDGVGKSADAGVTLRQIGNRPAGAIPRQTPLVQMAEASLRYVDSNVAVQYLRGSTDANIPLSRGLPAVVVGLAHCANAHRVDEYLDTTALPQGMQQLALLTLAAAGL